MNGNSSTYPTFSAVDAELLDPEFFMNMVHWDECSSIGPSFAPAVETSPPPAASSPELPAAYNPPHTVHCVSTAFNTVTSPAPHHPPDVQLVSPDGVHFFVNASLLRKASSNDFAGTLQMTTAHAPLTPCEEPPCVFVLDSADVLNALLHTAYGASLANFRPSLETLGRTVRRLPAYGLEPQTHVLPGTVLFEALRRQAALAPMKIYVLAAAFDLFALAQMASAYLLTYPLYTLSDEEAQDMGSTYLSRLFMLQHNRVRALKDLLERPPEFHVETVRCNFAAQKGVARGWSTAIRQVMVDAGPGMTSSTLRLRLGQFKDAVACPQCKDAIDARIWQVVVDWTMTPATI